MRCPLREDVAGRPPEVDRVLVDLVRLDRRSACPALNAPPFLRIAAAGPHDAVAQQGRVAVGLHVDEPHHPVGVAGRGGGEQLRRDRAGHLDVFAPAAASCRRARRRRWPALRVSTAPSSMWPPVNGRRRRLGGIVGVAVGRLVAGRGRCSSVPSPVERVRLAAAVQVVLRPARLRQRPVLLGVPAIAAHHEDVHRRVACHAVVDALAGSDRTSGRRSRPSR